jgi:N-acetylglucosaminyldiphosphoundecaprenol N-acetyl-beta-D-mannosaminyltransferase
MHPDLAFRRDFAGIAVSPWRWADLLAAVQDALTGGGPVAITSLNPDYARRAWRSPALRDWINAFDAVCVDGVGVQLLCPLYGFVAPQRLDTDAAVPRLLGLCARTGAPVFLFGSAPGIARAAADTMVTAVPGLAVAGVEHGHHDLLAGSPGEFPAAATERIVADVNASGAAVLLVGLPTPLQQRWVVENRDRLTPSVLVTVGSYLDHVADAGRPGLLWYPPLVDRLRLNWLYRLVREPRRLWRRYTVETADYLGRAVWYRVRRARSGTRGGQA